MGPWRIVNGERGVCAEPAGQSQARLARRQREEEIGSDALVDPRRGIPALREWPAACRTCWRLGTDPQPPGDLYRIDVLLKHLRGLQPQLLAAGPSLSGQGAAIGVPQHPGVDPPPPGITQAHRM